MAIEGEGFELMAGILLISVEGRCLPEAGSIGTNPI
jgi:hypothetical protein